MLIVLAVINVERIIIVVEVFQGGGLGALACK